jgi:hypothetical protein
VSDSCAPVTISSCDARRWNVRFTRTRTCTHPVAYLDVRTYDSLSLRWRGRTIAMEESIDRFVRLVRRSQRVSMHVHETPAADRELVRAGAKAERHERGWEGEDARAPISIRCAIAHVAGCNHLQGVCAKGQDEWKSEKVDCIESLDVYSLISVSSSN